MFEGEAQDRDDDSGLHEATWARPVICHAQTRWDGGVGRTQALMTRLASHRRVIFVEPPAAADTSVGHLDVRNGEGGVLVVTPRLSRLARVTARERRREIDDLMQELTARTRFDDPVAWYDGPLAFGERPPRGPAVVVYDCAEAATARAAAAPAKASATLAEHEADLLCRADLVLAAGHSLYEAHAARHPRVYCLPSGVDTGHFYRARAPLPPPADQRGIAGPRLGFAGVIDDRVDLAWIERLATARADWQIVLVGSVVRRGGVALPAAPNLHYLGPKSYDELPRYLAGWDVCLLPLVVGEATRFCGPGRALEALAAGRPVVSTPVPDVMRALAPSERGGGLPHVHVAADVDATVAGVERALATDARRVRADADRLLARVSWDETAQQIAALLHAQGGGGQARRRLAS